MTTLQIVRLFNGKPSGNWKGVYCEGSDEGERMSEALKAIAVSYIQDHQGQVEQTA